MTKEEEPLLQNQNANTPTTTHKIHLLRSDNTDIALKSHKISATATDDCQKDEDGDKERFQVEFLDTHDCKKEENTAEDTKEEALSMSSPSSNAALKEESGIERLKRHRIEVAGQVWIPDTWGQEDLLKDWIDCSTFDSDLVPKGIMSARASLAEEGRRATSGRIGVQNRC